MVAGQSIAALPRFRGRTCVLPSEAAAHLATAHGHAGAVVVAAVIAAEAHLVALRVALVELVDAQRRVVVELDRAAVVQLLLVLRGRQGGDAVDGQGRRLHVHPRTGLGILTGTGLAAVVHRQGDDL